MIKWGTGQAAVSFDLSWQASVHMLVGYHITFQLKLQLCLSQDCGYRKCRESQSVLPSRASLLDMSSKNIPLSSGSVAHLTSEAKQNVTILPIQQA